MLCVTSPGSVMVSPAKWLRTVAEAIAHKDSVYILSSFTDYQSLVTE
jgi:hypothetical protein